MRDLLEPELPVVVLPLQRPELAVALVLLKLLPCHQMGIWNLLRLAERALQFDLRALLPQMSSQLAQRELASVGSFLAEARVSLAGAFFALSVAHHLALC